MQRRFVVLQPTDRRYRSVQGLGQSALLSLAGQQLRRVQGNCRLLRRAQDQPVAHAAEGVLIFAGDQQHPQCLILCDERYRQCVG